MNVNPVPINSLPVAESVTNEDKIPVYKNQTAYAAPAALFRGDPATINGKPAVTIQAGENVTLTQENEELTISAADTVYSPATASNDGLMSAADKSKLDGIATGAEANVLENISVNGTAVPISDKAVDLTLTKSTVGLGSVDNTSDADKPVSTAQQAALDTKLEGIKVNGTAAPVTNKVAELSLTKSTVGLANVDNTSDADKPVSTVQQTALNAKVDKVSGKGLSTNDFTTAEKNKLLSIEPGAQVNEITLGNYQSLIGAVNKGIVQSSIFQKQLLDFRSAFYNFLYATGDPLYKEASGTGVISIRDAAAGQIHSITVDPALSGQRLYVQLNNANGLTDANVTINSDGAAFVSLATTKGVNTLFVTTSAYVFPPGSGGSHGSHTGTYVNWHKDENGHWAYDKWIPNNSVEATVHYCQDVDLADLIAKTITEDEYYATRGLRVTYAVTSDPAAIKAAGKEVFVKIEGYPFATKDKPVYAICNYPHTSDKVFYVAEYHYL